MYVLFEILVVILLTWCCIYLYDNNKVNPINVLKTYKVIMSNIIECEENVNGTIDNTLTAVLEIIDDGELKQWDFVPIRRHQWHQWDTRSGIGFELCPSMDIGPTSFEMLFSINKQVVHINLNHLSEESVQLNFTTYFYGINQLSSNDFNVDSANDIIVTNGLSKQTLIQNVSVTEYRFGHRFAFSIQEENQFEIAIKYQDIVHIPKIELTSNLSQLNYCYTSKFVLEDVGDEYFDPDFVDYNYYVPSEDEFDDRGMF